ncbi:MAG: hypothetical protein IKQ71_00405 [Lachnospiraceae bacterium]|nr:hypothetical protein [Lachnospiraceae bacterium]
MRDLDDIFGPDDDVELENQLENIQQENEREMEAYEDQLRREEEGRQQRMEQMMRDLGMQPAEAPVQNDQNIAHEENQPQVNEQQPEPQAQAPVNSKSEAEIKQEFQVDDEQYRKDYSILDKMAKGATEDQYTEEEMQRINSFGVNDPYWAAMMDRVRDDNMDLIEQQKFDYEMLKNVYLHNRSTDNLSPEQMARYNEIGDGTDPYWQKLAQKVKDENPLPGEAPQNNQDNLQVDNANNNLNNDAVHQEVHNDGVQHQDNNNNNNENNHQEDNELDRMRRQLQEEIRRAKEEREKLEKERKEFEEMKKALAEGKDPEAAKNEPEKEPEKKGEQPKDIEVNIPNRRKGNYEDAKFSADITTSQADEAYKLTIVADMTVLHKKSSKEFKAMQKAVDKFEKFMKGIKGRASLTAEELEKYDKLSYDVYKTSDDYAKKKKEKQENDPNYKPSKYEQGRIKSAEEIRQSVQNMRKQMFEKQIKEKVDEIQARCEQQLENLEKTRAKLAENKDDPAIQTKMENNVSHTLYYSKRMDNLKNQRELELKPGESFSHAIDRLNASVIPREGEIGMIKDDEKGRNIINQATEQVKQGKPVTNENINQMFNKEANALVPDINAQRQQEEIQRQHQRNLERRNEMQNNQPQAQNNGPGFGGH